MEGNALAVCCHLGMAHSLRVRRLGEVLPRSQWPDGGWNCDLNPDAHHSSFHETLAPIWGLAEYHRNTGEGRARRAARRAAELLLEHRLFRRTSDGEAIHPEWLNIHWPHYWHYDFFHGLRAIARLDLLTDRRGEDARGPLLQRPRGDGAWRAGGERYWRLRRAATLEGGGWGEARGVGDAAPPGLCPRA